MSTLTDAVNALVTNTTGLQTTVTGRITDMDGKIASADTAKVAAEAAKALAEIAKSGADTAKTDAETAQTLAQSAKTAAETAQGIAATAKTDAELAKGASETAKGNAIAAQTAAESANTQAQDWASKTTGAVAGGEYSAKYQAQQAATSATTAASIVSNKADTTYVDAQIANVDIPGASVGGDLTGTVINAQLGNDVVELVNLAHGTAGKVIGFNSVSGEVSEVDAGLLEKHADFSSDGTATYNNGIQVGDSGATCDLAHRGTMKYSSSDNELMVCSSTAAGGYAWSLVSEATALVSSVSPTSYDGNSNQSFTITGAGFKAGGVISFVSSTGGSFNASSTTITSSTSVIAVTGADFTVAQGPLSIVYTSTKGAKSSLSGAITTGNNPVWSSPNASIGSVSQGDTVSYSASAIDPDGGTLVYSKGSNCPSWLSINQSGTISGTVPSDQASSTLAADFIVTDTAGNSVTSNFTLQTTVPAVYGYTSTGNSTWTCPTGVTSISFLLVAGGGVSAGDNSGGGGGGGVVYQPSQSVTPGNSYTLTIGSGSPKTGTRDASATPPGGNTSAFGSTANGGGSGMSSSTAVYGGYNNGGSGAGANRDSGCSRRGVATQTSQSSGDSYHGNDGGCGAGDGNRGGGGGGAGEAGGNAATNGVGPGGAGINYSSVFGSIYGEQGWFAGGGAGGSQSNDTPASGGQGGGGQGYTAAAIGPGENGQANTGGGGGGESGGGVTGCCGGGGSGIILLKY